ncbi:hypothetical protein D1872_301840 [compost metagenome]
MVEVNCDRNGNLHVMQKTFHHFDYGIETAHMARSTFGYPENDRRFLLFRRSQNRLRPLKVVDVVLTYSVFPLKRFVQHVCHRY